MTTDSSNSKWKWWRPRFGLRTFFCLILVLGILLGAFSYVGRRAQLQRAAVDRIRASKESDSRVEYDFNHVGTDWFFGIPEYDENLKPDVPGWLLDSLGVDFFCNVTDLNVESPDTLVDFPDLTSLGQLKMVWLDNTDTADLAPLGRSTGMQRIFAGYTKISSIKTLSSFPQLEWLHLDKTDVADISSLRGLRELRHLDLVLTKVADLSPLENATQLETLNVSRIPATDYSHLKNLVNLKTLTIDPENGIVSDLSFLERLTKLEDLKVQNVSCKNISVLSRLKNLKALRVSFSEPVDLSPIAELANLEYLQIEAFKSELPATFSNLVNVDELSLRVKKGSDYSPLSQMPKLDELTIVDPELRDIEFLRPCIGLRQLRLTNNQVSDISVVKNFSVLYRLNLRFTQVADLSPLSELKRLESLDLSNTPVANIDALPVLAGNEGSWLSLDHTSVTDISRFAKDKFFFYNLNLSYTQINDFSPLKASNIYNLNLEGTSIEDLSQVGWIMQTCNIGHSKVVDLLPVDRLRYVETLSIFGCKIPADEVLRFQQLVPECEIINEDMNALDH